MSKVIEQIKVMVADDHEAWFRRYHDGNLWYQVVWDQPVSTEDGKDKYFPERKEFEFPVPVTDIGSATFHARERAILMMRYIRKHLELLEGAGK